MRTKFSDSASLDVGRYDRSGTLKATMNTNAPVTSSDKRTMKRYALVAAISWTLLILGIVTWSVVQHRQGTLESALLQAAGAFEKDVVYRRWASMHGGVYVPPTEQSPPNPYLANIDDRDVTTTTGKKLTLINPAYMTRQVHRIGLNDYGHRGHITSLNPIRPENAPDPWEAEALKSFERGEIEVSALAMVEGEQMMRLMRPLVTEESCLKCHAEQDYEIGDIRGGISVSVPMVPLRDVGVSHIKGTVTAYTFIWLLGILGITVSYSRITRDINERRRSETELQKLASVIKHSGELVNLATLDGTMTFINDAGAEMLGLDAEKVSQTNIMAVIPDRLKDLLQFELLATVKRGGVWKGELQYLNLKTGDVTDVYAVIFTISDSDSGAPLYLANVSIDITERKRLEGQLQQAQKMESVGRLAGGIAHDFNNMLGVILGHAELALKELEDSEHLLHRHLQAIHNAAQRSSNLTRQLLAFARKQTIAPKILDLNETVAGMLTMLTRLIGEDIKLTWHPKGDLWPVRIDPSQLDQILANLCVNARSAISSQGEITVKSGTAVFDKQYCRLHEGAAPGEYVQLTVSDNGAGMDKETLKHIFEPFFTTKGVGEGTGLGLATVYGIVKQNNGFINVYSEPGIGTTFNIYLPRHEEQPAPTSKTAPAKTVIRGSETILLVEDEPAILVPTTNYLQKQGYTVLAASDPEKAIKAAKDYTGEIHLLLTDVIMPGMNGRELSEQLIATYPDLKRLFMSGYPRNAIGQHGVLDEELDFIAKPFSMKSLAEKIREVLERE